MHQHPIETCFYNINPYNKTQICNPFTTTNPDMNYGHICPVYRYYHQRYDTPSIKISKTALINKLHMLWKQHIVWTRLAITSILNDSSDVDLVTKRLLQNPIDFERALRPFYGDKIATEFRKLLT